MTAPVVVFGIGNRSRGDDAVGPLLLDRLRAWLSEQGQGDGFELLEEHQLQVENALDLEGRRLALFIDAFRGAPTTVAFGPVGAAAIPAAASSHALSPGAVLGVYMRVTGEGPPPAYVLGVRADAFDLGTAPSTRALAAMEDAWAMLRGLACSPRHAEWQTMAAVARHPRAVPA